MSTKSAKASSFLLKFISHFKNELTVHQVEQINWSKKVKRQQKIKTDHCSSFSWCKKVQQLASINCKEVKIKEQVIKTKTNQINHLLIRLVTMKSLFFITGQPQAKLGKVSHQCQNERSWVVHACFGLQTKTCNRLLSWELKKFW